MLYSCNGPDMLADTWQRISDDPIEYQSVQNGMSMRHDGSKWIVQQDFVTIARANSAALHPVTVYAGEWELCEHISWDDERVHFHWVTLKDFFFSFDIDRHFIYTLADVGADYFVRIRSCKPFQWYDPTTGQVENSGAKGGKRYCFMCGCSTSANNFVHQHLPACFAKFSATGPKLL